MSNAISSKPACQVMAKPTGSICNLDCKYCFYLEKEKLYPERNRDWKMSESILDAYIKQHIEAQDINEVCFAWQGGEPTLMGIDFYKKAVSLQKKYAGNKKIVNAFQTNGVLLNDEWCEFLKEHNFLVGISIDGPEELHDKYRVTRSGKPSFSMVMNGIDMLKKYGVEFNTLTVISDANARKPMEVYRFLKSIGSTYLQFIPLVERKAEKCPDDGLYLVSPDFSDRAQVTSWSVKSVEYGQFLNTIFDEWVRNDVGKVFVQMFDVALASWLKQPAHLCIFSPTCGNAFALEANGDMYVCDHYVYPDYKLGNIDSTPIKEMKDSRQAHTFGESKRSQLTSDCLSCNYQFMCHGGCPKHRFSLSPNGIPNHNYLCKGYKQFFSHSEKYMKIMADMFLNRRNAANVMKLIEREESNKNKAETKRNDPCPCGSDKKYKNCCKNK